MDYIELPAVDAPSDLTIPQLKNEAQRLGVDDEIKSNMRKAEIIEVLEPYTDKQKYREARSKTFCRRNGLRSRSDLNSEERRNLDRILNQGKTLGSDSYGNKHGLPYNVKKKE